MSYETRTFILTYQDKKTNCIHKEKVTDVIQNQFVINNIDPTLACYIGMQGGYIAIKHGSQIFDKISHKPFLKLVK